jgi:bacterioferritin
MKKYMLILFSYGGLKKINQHLEKKLKPKDKLLVRALMIEEVPKLFEHLISDVGFLGEKVVSDVEDSVVDIYQENAKDYLEEIAEMAAAKDFELDKKLIEEQDLEKVKAELKTSELDGIFINFSDNEFVSNQVKEDELKKWLQEIKLPLDIFYDGEKKK